MTFLQCPKCKENLFLSENKKSYLCKNNHLYDISKYGYVNLLLSKTNCGDNLTSTKARELFLSKGYYEPLLQHINNIFTSYNMLNVLDIGCGVGYYLSALSSFFNTTGVDISKEAITIASKKDKRSLYVVSSSSDMPFVNNCFDGAYAIFAPIFEKELARVLKDDGIFILVNKNTNHLYELKSILYDDPYYNPVKVVTLNNFNLLSSFNLTYKVTLDNLDIKNLVLMTPYQYKTKTEGLKKLDSVDKLTITIDFNISIYKKSNN